MLMVHRADWDVVWKVPDSSAVVSVKLGALTSTSPLSIVPGTPEVVGSAVNRPTIAIGPGEIPVKLPATPETPITKSVLMVPGSVLPGSVLDVQVKVFCCSSWPDPRTPVASNSTMRPWRPFESIANMYVGEPDRLLKTSWPRLSAPRVYVPVKVRRI